MLGRISGKYMPGNPSSYRIKNRSMSGSGVVHQYENNNNNNSHFSQQKNVLDSTKSNANGDSNDNIENAPKPFDIVKYINSQFQPFDKKARETRQKQEIEELILDIESRLYDFYTHEHVQTTVTQFRNRLYATTDYNGFNTELENYRTALIKRYLGR
jgi:hypothetical protein